MAAKIIGGDLIIEEDMIITEVDMIITEGDMIIEEVRGEVIIKVTAGSRLTIVRGATIKDTKAAPAAAVVTNRTTNPNLTNSKVTNPSLTNPEEGTRTSMTTATAAAEAAGTEVGVRSLD